MGDGIVDEAGNSAGAGTKDGVEDGATNGIGDWIGAGSLVKIEDETFVVKAGERIRFALEGLKFFGGNEDCKKLGKKSDFALCVMRD